MRNRKDGQAVRPWAFGCGNRLFVNAVLWVLRSGGHRKKGGDQALGRSGGGLTTKIHIACDTLGRPPRVILSPGPAGDAPRALALMERFRRIATRYDRKAIRFRVFIYISILI